MCRYLYICLCIFVFVTPTFNQFSRAQPQGGSLTIRVISCSVKKIESSIFFISASTVALPWSDHHRHNDHSTPRTSLTWTGWVLPIRAILMSRFVDLSVPSSPVRPFSKSVKTFDLGLVRLYNVDTWVPLISKCLFSSGDLWSKDGEDRGDRRWTRTSKVQWDNLDLHVCCEKIKLLLFVWKILLFCLEKTNFSYQITNPAGAEEVTFEVWSSSSYFAILNRDGLGWVILKSCILYLRPHSKKCRMPALHPLKICQKWCDKGWPSTIDHPMIFSFHMKVWDKDTISRDDFIGRVT